MRANVSVPRPYIEPVRLHQGTDENCGHAILIVVEKFDGGSLVIDTISENEIIALEGLITGISEKDEEAFGQFYDMTHSKVYGLALKISRQPEAAEEIVSDTYFYVWKNASAYDITRGSAIGWLMMICRSRALDALRRIKGGNEIAIDNISESDMTDKQAGPLDLLLSTERQSAVHTALASLNEQQRQMLALAYYRGYTHQQLVNFTGMPLGTVKTQIRRAVLILKESVGAASANEST